MLNTKYNSVLECKYLNMKFYSLCMWENYIDDIVFIWRHKSHNHFSDSYMFLFFLYQYPPCVVFSSAFWLRWKSSPHGFLGGHQKLYDADRHLRSWLSVMWPLTKGKRRLEGVGQIKFLSFSFSSSLTPQRLAFFLQILQTSFECQVTQRQVNLSMVHC